MRKNVYKPAHPECPPKPWRRLDVSKGMSGALLYLTLLLLSLTIPADIQSATQKTSAPCRDTTSNMAILIDESEVAGLSIDPTKLTATSWTLSDVLDDKSSILIVSDHLLNNIGYFSHPAQKNWLARKLSKNISVLVPANLATVADDYQLGIYFSHYQPLKETDLTSRTINQDNLSLEATDAILTLIIPRSDYWARWHGQVMPRGFNLLFFAHGLEAVITEIYHGDPVKVEGRIAGFLTPDANRLLVTLIDRIVSAFFISCLSGDITALALISKSQAQLGQAHNFPFPIVLSTPLASRVRTLGHRKNFRAFFAELTDHCEHPDLLNALSNIYSSSGTNIPVVKRPGIPVFFPLDPTKYGEIGTILGATRTEPLAIPSYFQQKELLALLVHAPVIPFRVVLNPDQDPLPLFFSAEPGPRIHQFTGGFDASSYPLSSVIDAFTAIKQSEWKIFTFNSITARDDAINRDNRVREFKNIVIINHLVSNKTGNLKTEKQTPVVLITYALDGRAVAYEKTINTSTDAQHLGETAAKDAVPLTGNAQKNISALIETISKMAQNPMLVNPELLKPQIGQIEKISGLLTRQTKKQTADEKADLLLSKFAKSLRMLAQPSQQKV